MRKRGFHLAIVSLLLAASFFTGRSSTTRWPLVNELAPFFDLLSSDGRSAERPLSSIEATWNPSYVVMLVELLRFVSDRSVFSQIIAVLDRRTGHHFRSRQDKWFEWIWGSNTALHPEYAEYKARLYERFDSRFREYFENNPQSTIRLDEILWGGVERDGIPPLDHPRMISASEATYLEDSNVVFGVEINGDARAYPKRILAWHEMVKDQIGGQELNGVYCTLCGSMILYQTTVDGVHHELGTSGFLYRSNKLMYDHATKSLWSTLTGKPVVGPLVGKGIELQPLHVVTTTWGPWRRRHPNTKVLSLDTGYQRNYGEGAAYRNYFASEELMFPVPRIDQRLENKAEVLAIRFLPFPDEQLAISSDFLSSNPVYHDKVGTINFVVLTDPSGANRVYETKGRKFVSWDGSDTATEQEQNTWRVTEAHLSSKDGSILKRLPAHRAFWFGWYSAYQGTRLVK